MDAVEQEIHDGIVRYGWRVWGDNNDVMPLMDEFDSTPEGRQFFLNGAPVYCKWLKV